MGMYDVKFLLDDSQHKAASASANSTYEINFGVTKPGFKNFGAHIVIENVYAGINSGINILVKTGNAVACATTLIARLLTATQMKVKGAHYFVPIPPNSLLRCARLQYYPVSENSAGAVGALSAWFGPDTEDSI